MAKTSYSMATILLSIILLVQVYADVAITTSQNDIENHGPQTSNEKFSPRPHIDCVSLCKHRCSKASEPKICTKDCEICCAKCKCVPYGSIKDACPCYTNWKTTGGKHKCP